MVSLINDLFLGFARKLDILATPQQANKITKIHLHYTISGEGIVEEKLKKALILAQKNCPMAQTIIDSVELTESYTLTSHE